jgi:hypothetical protein
MCLEGCACGRHQGLNARHEHTRVYTASQTYTSWAHLRRRNYDVDPSWRNSFSQFVSDMGVKPTPEHRLVRVDKAQGFSVSNCEWQRPMRKRSRSDNTLNR